MARVAKPKIVVSRAARLRLNSVSSSAAVLASGDRAPVSEMRCGS
jgi:hypothetical protein